MQLSVCIDVQEGVFHLHFDIDYSFQASGILTAGPLEIFGISTMLQNIRFDIKMKKNIFRRKI